MIILSFLTDQDENNINIRKSMSISLFRLFSILYSDPPLPLNKTTYIFSFAISQLLRSTFLIVQTYPF